MAANPRLLAPLSLVLAVLLFLATWPFQHVFWAALLHAFAEAAMIGGLADWFAVVALFRRPLGLPIPHTGIIPLHRQRITNGIIDMVQHSWLSREAIRARIEGWEIGAALSAWLGSERVRGGAVTAMRAVLREVIRGIDTAALVDAARGALRERITPEQLARGGAALGERVLRDGLHHPLVDAGIDRLRVWIAAPSIREAVTRTLRDAADGYASTGLRWTGKKLFELTGVLDYDDLAAQLLAAVDRDLEAARADPAHELRRSVDAQLTALIAAFPDGEHGARLAAELHAALFDGDAAIDTVTRAADRARTWLLDDLDAGESRLAAMAATLLDRARVRLDTDEEARRAVDHWIKDHLARLVDEYHGVIGTLVRDNLARLDDAQLVAQIESRVGGDLQYIRLNGALVGGMVGAGLFLLSRALGF